MLTRHSRRFHDAVWFCVYTAASSPPGFALMRRLLPSAVLLAAPVCLAACAARPAAAPSPDAAISHATVVAVRPVVPAGAVLSLLGSAEGAGGVSSGAAGMTRQEVILRTEDGRIVSLVQAGGASLRPGQAVTLGGDPARLTGS